MVRMRTAVVLPAPLWPEQPEDRAGRDLEVEVAQRPQVAEALAEPLGDDPGLPFVRCMNVCSCIVRPSYQYAVRDVNEGVAASVKAGERRHERRSGRARRPASAGRPTRREQIAAAALRIADAEGFEAVSMRRVAAELGAGTMTLYHYVRNKDELVGADGRRDHGRAAHPRGRAAPTAGARASPRSPAARVRGVPAPPVGVRAHRRRTTWTGRAERPAPLRAVADGRGRDRPRPRRASSSSSRSSTTTCSGSRPRARGRDPREARARRPASTRARATSTRQLATGEFPHLAALGGRRRARGVRADRRAGRRPGPLRARPAALLDGIELRVKG